MSKWKEQAEKLVKRWKNIDAFKAHVLETFLDRDASLKTLEQTHVDFISQLQYDRIYAILGDLDAASSLTEGVKAEDVIITLRHLLGRLADMIEEIYDQLSVPG